MGKSRVKLPFENEPQNKHVKVSESGDSFFIRLTRKSMAQSTLRKAKIETNVKIAETKSFFETLTEQFFGQKQISDSHDHSQDFLKGIVQQNSKKRVGTDPTISLNNQYNFAYTGPVYMGTTPSLITDLIYDTGSDWLVVASSTCSNCDMTGYDITTSTAYVKTSTTQSEHAYGSADLFGYNSTDDVYLDASKTIGATNFPFCLIVDQTGLSGLNGILGMSRSYSTSNFVAGPLYAQYLFDQSAISSALYAFYMANTDAQSFVQIGTWSSAYMKDPTNKAILNLPQHFFWLHNSSAVKIGDGKFANGGQAQYKLPDTYPAIFDTGTSLAYLPATIGSDIIGKILRGKRYTQYGGTFYCQCDASLYDSLYIMFDGNWLEISPQTYLVDVSDAQDGSLCILGLVVNQQDYWLLGDVFLRGYYSIFNLGSNTLTFSPRTNSPVGAIQTGSIPTEIFDKVGPTVTYYGGLFMGLLSIVICPVMCIIGCLLCILNQIFGKSKTNNSDNDSKKLLSSIVTPDANLEKSSPFITHRIMMVE